MKKTILLSGVALMLAAGARGTIFTGAEYGLNSGTLNTVITDGSVVGIMSTLSVDLGVLPAGTIDQLRDVNVSLVISGGYNGDLYGYLVSPEGTRVDLLNRVGTGAGSEPQYTFGFADPGFNINLVDGVANADIHGVNGNGSQVVGTYESESGTLNTAFSGQTAYGTWTLFLADLSNDQGLNNSTLVEWNLTLDVVPEPTTWAAIIFGTLFAGVQVTRCLRHRKTA